MADFDVKGFDDDGANHTNDFNPVTDEGWFTPDDFPGLKDFYRFYLKHYNSAESAEIGATGTGLFNPFLNMNGDSTLRGFNTNDDIKKPYTDADLDISDPNTDAIQLGDIPIIYRDLNGDSILEAYYVINLDINENVNTDVSLEELQLFTSSSSATLTNYRFDDGDDLAFSASDGFQLRFDLDANGDNKLIMRDDGAGQGKLDYTFYFPVGLFSGSSPNDYLTLFSQFGPTPPDDAGFAEWNVLTAAKIAGIKFKDVNADGVRDENGVDNILGNSDDEVGLAGFTMYIDLNGNNKLDANEQTALTDSTGAFQFASLLPNTSYTIREVLTTADVNGPGDAGPDVNFATYAPPAGAWEQTTDPLNDGDQIINVTTGTTNILVGNALLTPQLSIDKSASVPGDCADTVGERVLYTVVLDNTGNVALNNVVLTDSFEGGGYVTKTVTGDTNLNGIVDGAEVWRTGDTGNDGIMGVNETWTYQYVHTVTQADIDGNGGGNGTLDNIARGNATAVGSGQAADQVQDDASVDVCQDPALSIDKTATVPGDCADTVGEKITYTVVLDNIGNVALNNVVLTDSFEGGSFVTLTVTGDTNTNGILDAGEVWRTGDTGNDGIMGVNETWTYMYVHTVTQADIDGGGPLDNIAKGNATAVVGGEAAEEVQDDASVIVCQDPALSIDKTAAVPGDCADVVGERVLYTVVLDNIGNVALNNVVLTDSFEGGSYVTKTVTGDTNLNGIVDGAEVWRTGDTGNDGIMGVNETWTYMYVHTVTQADIDGNGGGDGTLDNIAKGNATAVGGEAAEEVQDDASVDVCQYPTLSIDKTASVPGDCADTVGELITYTVVLDNIGNVALNNVVLTDSFEGGSYVTKTVTGDTNLNGIVDGAEVWRTGDTGNDGIMGVNETWTYMYVHAVTQADIDAGGTLDNIAKGNATAVVSGDAAQEVQDDASVDVCQDILVELKKYVDVGFGWDDANTGPGPQNVNLIDDVDFKITIENTGNVTLTAVDVTDTYLSGGAPGTANLLVDDGVLTAYALAHDAVLTGDTGNDGILGVDEIWTITYTQPFDPLSVDPGAHLNTADVTTDEGATDEDSAYYFSLVSEGPGVRTPGFWQNQKNGGQFWDGNTGNAKHDGEACFPTDDLLRKDSNHDGTIDGSDSGYTMYNGQLALWIGDYDRDGEQDAGEDILVISRTDALKLLSANTKDMSDMAVKIGRDAVATWLNYLAGNEIGSDPDATYYSPKEAINDAIDYLQTYAGVANGGSSETFDVYKPTHTAVTNKANPAAFAAGSPIHNALDEYNNFGTINGHVWAHDCDDQAFVTALTVFQSAHPDLF